MLLFTMPTVGNAPIPPNPFEGGEPYPYNLLGKKSFYFYL
jgi:hypothetical protein